MTVRFFNCRHVKRGRKKDQMFKSKLELLVVRGVLSGRRFPVVVGGSRLGRSAACEIAIDDPLLSRQHCLFDYAHGELRLTDLASTNGTFERTDITALSATQRAAYNFFKVTVEMK